MNVQKIVKTVSDYPELGIQITVARKRAALKPPECARACGVSRQYWNQIENERLEFITPELLEKIEKALSVKFAQSPDKVFDRAAQAIEPAAKPAIRRPYKKRNPSPPPEETEDPIAA